MIRFNFTLTACCIVAFAVNHARGIQITDDIQRFGIAALTNKDLTSHSQEIMLFDKNIEGKQLFRAKLATMTVLKDAKEIRLDAGPYVNRIDNSGGSFKKYEKSGGYKQAYKDFKQFPADERQDYLIPYGGDGKWAVAGDRVVILERRKSRDWTSLIIKQGAGTPNEHIDKIIYKE